MKITTRQPDGTLTSTESDTFPCETVVAGWRVTLVMRGEGYKVGVKNCDPRCIETNEGQRFTALGIAEIKLFW